MFRFFPLFFVVLALVSSHVAFGAPSCSKEQVDGCISKCKHKFGWPGHSSHHLTKTSSVVHPTATGDAPKPAKKKSPASSSTSTSATPSPTPTPPPSHDLTSDTGSSVSADDISSYLSAHNNVRAQHGAAPLTWSNDLSAKAQQWANGCVFQHSGGSLGPFGENLAAGTGTFSIANAVGSWNAEASQYDPNNPVPSHFTQVVWKATTQVGCAVQKCNGIFDASFGPAEYYVCEYSPQGNVIGEFAQNVQA